MKNFIYPEDLVDLPAPEATTSGQMKQIGSMLAVATVDLASAAVGAWACNGCFLLPKVTTDVMAVGAKLYWDNTAKKLTVTVASNLLAGVCIEAAGNGVTDVKIRLNGSF